MRFVATYRWLYSLTIVPVVRLKPAAVHPLSPFSAPSVKIVAPPAVMLISSAKKPRPATAPSVE